MPTPPRQSSLSRHSATLLFTTAVLFSASGIAKIEKILGNVDLSSNLNLGLHADTPESEIVISRDQYVISYNREKRAPHWAAWKVEMKDLGSAARSNAFNADLELDNYLVQTSAGHDHAVSPADYKGSCFDRGHQVPSADRTATPTDNEATFMMSNMLPQTPYLNRVIWEHLESYTRILVKNQNKKVYIITGPIYDAEIGNIGLQRDIPIPSKNFKILVVLDADQTPNDINENTPAIAVIMPNILENGATPEAYIKGCPQFNVSGGNNTNRPDYNDWKKYITTITEVERQSGLHFYATQSFKKRDISAVTARPTFQ